MSKRVVRVASIQMDVVENDKEAAVEKALERIRGCGDADLIILPELWNIGFMSFDRYRSEAEDIEGPTISMVAEAARETGSYIHAGSFVEADGGRFYNSSFLLSPDGKIVARYRKIHLFGYDSQESRILSPGDSVVVTETPFGKVGMTTCYDLRFPELFRAMVDMGAELFLVCSAWPYPRLEPWLLFNQARALENQAFLVSSNCSGINRSSQYVGHSMVVDPWGTRIAGSGDNETIVRAEIDLGEVESARSGFPALADRKKWLLGAPTT